MTSRCRQQSNEMFPNCSSSFYPDFSLAGRLSGLSAAAQVLEVEAGLLLYFQNKK